MKKINIIGFFFAVGAMGCQPPKPESESKAGPRSFVSASVQTWDDIAGLDAQPTRIRADLAAQHCLSVYKLPMKSDFAQEFSVLCDQNKVAANFVRLDRYAELVEDKPRSVKLALKHEADGFTEGLFVTVYRVPIAPKWVRSAAIPEYMVSASVYDYAKLEGLVTHDLTADLGGDLQFGKWQLKYHTDVQTEDGSSFSNDRSTELNSYQVQGGNPDIGIGAEHLIDTANPNYKLYNTTTITIGNSDGGSTLMTIIRVSVKNNGYPDLAEKVISDIASAQASQVREGLMRELAAGNFP